MKEGPKKAPKLNKIKLNNFISTCHPYILCPIISIGHGSWLMSMTKSCFSLFPTSYLSYSITLYFVIAYNALSLLINKLWPMVGYTIKGSAFSRFLSSHHTVYVSDYTSYKRKNVALGFFYIILMCVLMHMRLSIDTCKI